MSATRAMLRNASEVVLMREMSSELSWDSRWCCEVARGILVRYRLAGGAGGGWGGGDGLRNEAGWLGLGACQFGLSEGLGLQIRESLWGGESLLKFWDH